MNQPFQQEAGHPGEDTDLSIEQREQELDEQVEETFPASDAPSTTPITRVGSPQRDEDEGEGE